MNTADCLREFQRKYQGTYFFTKPSKESDETLVYCQAIELTSSGGAIMSCNGLRVGQLQYNIPSEHMFVFKMPPVGVFQVGHSAVQVQRAPRRQWSRGICEGNTFMGAVTRKMFSGINTHFTLENIDTIFAQHTYTVREALSMLKSGKFLSIALKDDFSLALSTVVGSTDYLLLHNSDVVGLVKSDTGLVERILNASYVKQVNQLILGG